MDFSTYQPVRIFTGAHCLSDHSGKLASFGKKAYLVTGKHGADACGAFGDVAEALRRHGIPYLRMNRVTENPPAPLCLEAGRECRENGCDFVIGIGGGSALDAAKAIAAYAANPDAGEMDIFDLTLAPAPGLPMIAVPTTAGTGSEACPYSILTIDGGLRKKTFKSPSSYPRCAFVDPRYTYSLSRMYSVSTALDTLAHCLESFLSPKADELSRKAALFGGHEVWAVLFRGESGEGPVDEGGLTPLQRERLLYAATAGGIAIGVTGTGFPHPLGYSLTLSCGIPHGRACAAFEGAYITYNRKNPTGEALLQTFASALGASADEMAERIPAMGGVDLALTEAECEEMIRRVEGAKNYANSPYVISREEMSAIYRGLFCRK